MNLINLTTKEYPVSIYTIRAANLNTSYPDNPNFVPEGYALVNSTVFPDYDRNTQKVIELAPAQDGDKWQQVWKVTELTVEEQQKIRDEQAQGVRNRRDALLVQCDWTQLPDSPVDQNSWKIYRQALRDITTQPGFPFDVVWPDSPKTINLSLSAELPK
jgi:hypothetical protein